MRQMPASGQPRAREPWPETYDKNTRQLLVFVRVAFVFVGTMPFWLPLARAWLPLGPVGQLLDGLFILVCHRLPERTLQLAGVAMPVCSRCGGIFAGLALGIVVAWPRLSLRHARWKRTVF